MQCNPALLIPLELRSQVTEIRDDGRYEFKCSFGHQSITLLQQQKFEILFQIGANAIIDGYYREAISSFSSSLERFYEFSLKVFLCRAGTSNELFKKSWKSVQNQSERQLGAFIFLWIIHFKDMPSLLETGKVAFRNDVIHKGKIPSMDEAIAYGDSVLEILNSCILQLQESYPDEISQVIHSYLREIGKIAQNKEIQFTTACQSTIVSLSNGNPRNRDKKLSEHLKELKKINTLFNL